MKKRSLLNPKGYRNRALLGSPVATGTAIVAALAVIILILRFAAPQAIVALSSPFWKAGTLLTAAVGNGSGAFESKDALAADRDRLATANAALTNQNAALASQAHDLQALLGGRQEPTPGIVAGVLSRPPLAPYDVLVVDQGSAEGAVANALVSGPGGTPVGIIESVTAHTARVVLYSNPGKATEGWLGDTRIPLTLTGDGAGAFQASVPKDAGAAVGMGVFVPGPGALPIGSVVRIDSDPSSPDVVVHVRPYVNPFSLTWVTIARV